MNIRITPDHLARAAVVYVRQSTMSQVMGNLESQRRQYDPDGAYDPRLVNDRLLLGLKGTMSEYELSLMRHRGIAARDSKAKRGEYRFMLPPGFCWSEAGRIEIDPDDHVGETVRLVFAKFRELDSARQVLLWLRTADIRMSVVLRNVEVCKVAWKAPAYHSVMQILHNPLYAGAYAFGRRAQRREVVDGRARKINGLARPQADWNVLLHDNHPGYITWQEYEANQALLLENAYMKKTCARKSARGGRALLTGLMRCGRCGRMMRVFYGMGKGNAHRYQCRGDDGHVGSGLCIGIGGVRVDRALASQILEAVSPHAIDAAVLASDQVERSLLMGLAHDLPTVWNAPSTDIRTKERLLHILVREIVCDLDVAANEAVLLIHWTGGRHTEVRVPRTKTGRWSGEPIPSAVEAVRALALHWPDRELAVSLNRMRCKTGDGDTWTTVRVREVRERLGIPEYDPEARRRTTISLMTAAERLGICVGSVKSLVTKGLLPATQILPGSPWLVPVAALASEQVRTGVQGVIRRRPMTYENYQYDKAIRLPGI